MRASTRGGALLAAMQVFQSYIVDTPSASSRVNARSAKGESSHGWRAEYMWSTALAPQIDDGIYLTYLRPVLLNTRDAASSTSTRHLLKWTLVPTPLITMRSPPLEVLKTWPKPNYEDPVTRGPTLMIVELTLLPIAMIIVALRMWVRIAWLKKSWYDDYTMVLAMVSATSARPSVAMLTPTRSFQ